MILMDGVCTIPFIPIWSSEYLSPLAATMIDALDTMARHRKFIYNGLLTCYFLATYGDG